MSELTLSSFYPNNTISCENDLPFDDGTYEVWERKVILNIFIIKNHRIEYHTQYNISIKKRLITWKFEYLEHNGKQLHNVWRQPIDTNVYDLLYSSTNWELYPEEYKKRIEHNKNFNICYDTFINNVKDCAINDKSPF